MSYKCPKCHECDVYRDFHECRGVISIVSVKSVHRNTQLAFMCFVFRVPLKKCKNAKLGTHAMHLSIQSTDIRLIGAGHMESKHILLVKGKCRIGVWRAFFIFNIVTA